MSILWHSIKWIISRPSPSSHVQCEYSNSNALMFEKEISSKTKVPTFQKSILKTFFYVRDTLCVAQKNPSKITDSEDSGQVNSRA